MRIVITGGGTGGHVYPALAVVDAMRASAPDVEIRYIGGAGGMEERIVRDAGLPFDGVTTRKLRKVASLDTILVLLALARGYVGARRALRRFRPQALLGTGGYVAAAAALAAARMGIPVAIHEQNAIPGRTNLGLAKRATRICVTFPETVSAFPATKTTCTGLPVRASVVAQASREEARAALGLPADVWILLVLGGSQGARALNECLLSAFAGMPEDVVVLHQTGTANYEQVAARAAETGVSTDRYRPIAYMDTHTIAQAYRAANAAFTRCGASTLAEATANGVPLIMTPLPTAYADHQTANARAIERTGAGILLPQAHLTAESLAQVVRELRNDPGRVSRMAAASKQAGKQDAANAIAKIVMDMAQR